MFKNKDKKFGLWGKRLVWNGEAPSMSAGAAVEAAAKEAETGESVDWDAEKLKVAAKKKLPSDPQPEWSDGEDKTPLKEQYDKAVKEIEGDKVQERFNEALAFIGKRVALQQKLVAIDTKTVDFMLANDQLQAVKRDLEVLNAGRGEASSVSLPNLGSVESAVNNAADKYYGGLVAKVPKQVTSREEYLSCMSIMGQLQQGIASEFSKIDGAKEKYEGTYDDAITNCLGLLSSDDGVDGVTDDELAALERFKKSRRFIDGAKNGEPGQKAGAEQYQSMMLAEQEALRAWQMLPVEGDDAEKYGKWRKEDAGVSVLLSEDGEGATWDVNGLNYSLYQEAVKLYNDALPFTKTGGDAEGRVHYEKARDLFRQSAAKFRELLANYKSKVKKKETEKTAERVEAYQLWEKLDTFKKKYSFLKDYFATNEADMMKAKGIMDNKEKRNYKEAKKIYEAVEKSYKKYEKDYLAAQTFMTGKAETAAAHCASNEVTSIEGMTKVFTDYLGSYGSGEVPDKLMLNYGRVSVVVKGVNGGNWGVAEVSFTNGVPSVNLQYRPGGVETEYKMASEIKSRDKIVDDVVGKVNGAGGDFGKMRTDLAAYAATLTNTEIDRLSESGGVAINSGSAVPIYVNWVNGAFWVRQPRRSIRDWKGKTA